MADEEEGFSGFSPNFFLGSPEERITELEYEVSRIRERALTLHEVSTSPLDTADALQTHPASSDLYKIHLVPFKFCGRIFLKRMSIICYSLSESPSGCGLSLYSLDNAFSASEVDTKTAPKTALKKIKNSVWKQISAASGTIRLDLEFERSVLLDSSRSIYYAAWTTDDVNARFLCPGSAATASTTFRSSFVASESASTSGVFPDNVSLVSDADSPTAPCVVGRSLTGIRAYGSFTDDV